MISTKKQSKVKTKIDHYHLISVRSKYIPPEPRIDSLMARKTGVSAPRAADLAPPWLLISVAQ